MVGERIAIDPEVIDAHAARVDEVAAGVRVVVQVASQTTLSAGAFGLMCSRMVPPLLATAGAATATMMSAASAKERCSRSAGSHRSLSWKPVATSEPSSGKVVAW